MQQIWIILTLVTMAIATEPCKHCGFNQECVNNTCVCKDTFELHSNDKDCVDVSCDIEDCVLCESNQCKRCVHYINTESRECIDTCSGTADVAYSGDVIGNTCTVNTEKMDIIIGVVAGVSATILLVALSILFLCLKVRQRRRHIKLQKSASTNKSPTMDTGRLKRLPIFENIGFEPDVSERDKEEFRDQVDTLKIHTDRLHLILYETRMKLRTMDVDDPRIPTYKGVIHQLCRVLVLLNKKDPCISIPGDGISLIGWANQMLEDYSDYQDNYTVTPCSSIRYSKFPSVSLDAQGIMTAVYAVPDIATNCPRPQQYLLHPVSSKIPGYYSSVPVPFIDVNQPPADYDNTQIAIHSSSDGSIPQSNISYNQSLQSSSHTREPHSRTSSHSDLSHQEFTTFTGGIPWLPTSASVAASRSSLSDSLINPDGLPFSVEEATEPIEV